MKKNPICGMAVDERTAERAEHEGQTYYFCGDGCRNKFPPKSTGHKACCCATKTKKLRRFGMSVLLAAGLLPFIVGCSKSKAGESTVGSSTPEVQVRNVVERLVPTRLEFTGQLVAPGGSPCAGWRLRHQRSFRGGEGSPRGNAPVRNRSSPFHCEV